MRFSAPQGTCLALCSLALLTSGCYSAGVVGLSAADAAGSPTATRPGSTANQVLLSAMGQPEGTASLSARADRGVGLPLVPRPEVGESIGRRGKSRSTIRRGGGLTTFGGFMMSAGGFQGNFEEERLGESGDTISRDAVSLPALISFHSIGPSHTRVMRWCTRMSQRRPRQIRRRKMRNILHLNRSQRCSPQWLTYRRKCQRSRQCHRGLSPRIHTN